ncbi:hypothetical protein [Flocculibacter collagenilyticus]|uniref:hypothetical protein n=1 Tax=Flocculibacter collagenilyticus TaxID=2744479 RepID=UPI0018F785B1|nr:hypothetical protein [Flocculibacter collagenilyticus]
MHNVLLSIRFILNALILTALISPCTSIANDNERIVVISHQDTNFQVLTQQQVKRIFLGNNKGAASKDNLKPINLPYEHPVRILFSNKAIGLTEARIKAFWAQMKFAGKGNPPIEFDNIEAVIEKVAQSPGYIGYVPLKDVAENAQIKILYML